MSTHQISWKQMKLFEDSYYKEVFVCDFNVSTSILNYKLLVTFDNGSICESESKTILNPNNYDNENLKKKKCVYRPDASDILL